MQPFAIPCLTCGAKLKVSDESLLGEILMCPKCHSMVLVEPPSEISATPTSSATPANQALAPPADLADSLALAPERADEAPVIDAPPLQVQAPPTPAPAVTAPQSASPAPISIPTVPASPPAPWHKWLVLGSAGTIGMMFVVSIWMFWKSSQSSSASAEAPSSAAASQVVATEEIPGNPTDKQDPKAAPQQQPMASDVIPSDDVAANPAESPAKTESDPQLADDPPATDEVAAVDVVQATADEPLLLPEDEPEQASQPEPSHAGAVGPPQESPFGGDTPVEYPIPGPNADIASRLSTPIAAIQVWGDAENRGSLRNMTTLLAQMTSVPIRLDPVALKRLGLNERVPVTVQQRDTTVSELLRVMIGRMGLEPVATGNHVLITLAGYDRILDDSRRYPFDDLAAGSQDVEQLVALIQHMVAPRTWGAAGGMAEIEIDGKDLHVTQSALAHREILVLCEKLRVARGVPPRSVFFRNSADPLTLTSRSLRAADKLAEPSDVTVSEQIPLTHFAQALQHRTGIEVAVDEMALLRARLSPEILVSYGGPQKPLAEILTDVLRAVGLTFRVIDESQIQMTTPLEITSTPEVEFFSLSGLVRNEAEAGDLVARIRAEIAPAYWSSSATDAHLHFDVPSNCLLVRAAQPVQQLLQSWLMQRKQPAN